MTDLMQELYGVFETERQEHLEQIRVVLARIAAGRVAEGDLTEAMRRIHSLKGAARVVGFSYIEMLAHDIETIFGCGNELPDDLRRVVGAALDAIDDWIALPASSRPKLPPELLLQQLRAGYRSDQNNVSEENNTSGAVAGPAIVLEQAPGLSEIAPPAPEQPSPDAVAAPANALDVRVSVESLDFLLRAAGELHTDFGQLDAANQRLREAQRELPRLRNSLNRTHGYGQSRQLSRPQPLTADRVLPKPSPETDDPIKAISAAIDTHTNAVRSLRRHLRELGEGIKAVRLTPAGVVFSSIRKMARDVAAFEGKDIEIETEGFDNTADRRVLQRLKDPIMHVLRNAISHGIEPADVREAAGKPTRGTVRLSIYASGGRLCASIEDDGRGLDRDLIRSRALEKGFITDAQAAVIDDEELDQLIFAPGFSTSAAVTEISGRGIGMSVVREAVTELQGSIQIEAKPGKGTRISLSVPKGFVAQPMLLMESLGHHFAVPSGAVARIERISPDRLRTVRGRPVLLAGDTSLSVISLGCLFGQSEIQIGREGAYALILRHGAGQRHALIVDRLIAVEECILQPPNFLDASRTSWAGVVAGRDGLLRLVVNVEALTAAATGDHRLSLSKPKQEVRRKSVLVVDDSVTTRTLEKAILEAHGYDVRLGFDGRDALAKLRSAPVDLVVSDVEMPNMSGFDLLAAMRADPALAELPLILVTSRDEPENKEKGMRLGANAYVVKQRFDQAELINTIQRLV